MPTKQYVKKLNGYYVKDEDARNLIQENSEDISSLKITTGKSCNPIDYGADPTGQTDSASAINDCILANKGNTVILTPGTYLVNSSILLPFKEDEKVNINGNGAKIVTTATVESLFIGGADRENAGDVNNVGFKSYIKDLTIDCSDGTVTNAFYNMQGFKDWHIINCRTYRTTNAVLVGDSMNSPADILISDCIFYGNGSEYAGTGIIANATDNYVKGTRIYGFREGFRIVGATVVDTTHVLLRWKDQTQTNFDPYPIDGEEFAEYYPLTRFAIITGPLRVSNSYADSVHTAAEINTTAECIFTNFKYFNARTGVDMHVFDVANRDPKLTISDSTVQLKSGGSSVTGLRVTNANPTLNSYAQISVKNIIIIGITALTNPFDLLLEGYPQKVIDAKAMAAETWYIAGVIANWHTGAGDSADVVVDIDGWGYNFRLSDTAIQQYAANTSKATAYTIGTIVENNALLICVKTSTAASHNIGNKITHAIRPNFNIYPVKGDNVARSTRLLSDYTDSVPTLSKAIYEAIGISAVTQ